MDVQTQLSFWREFSIKTHVPILPLWCALLHQHLPVDNLEPKRYRVRIQLGEFLSLKAAMRSERQESGENKKQEGN